MHYRPVDSFLVYEADGTEHTIIDYVEVVDAGDGETKEVLHVLKTDRGKGVNRIDDNTFEINWRPMIRVTRHRPDSASQ